MKKYVFFVVLVLAVFLTASCEHDSITGNNVDEDKIFDFDGKTLQRKAIAPNLPPILLPIPYFPFLGHSMVRGGNCVRGSLSAVEAYMDGLSGPEAEAQIRQRLAEAEAWESRHKFELNQVVRTARIEQFAKEIFGLNLLQRRRFTLEEIYAELAAGRPVLVLLPGSGNCNDMVVITGMNTDPAAIGVKNRHLEQGGVINVHYTAWFAAVPEGYPLTGQNVPVVIDRFEETWRQLGNIAYLIR